MSQILLIYLFIIFVILVANGTNGLVEINFERSSAENSLQY